MNRWDFDYASAHRLGRRVANIPGMGVDFSILDRAVPGAGLAAGSRAAAASASGMPFKVPLPHRSVCGPASVAASNGGR